MKLIKVSLDTTLDKNLIQQYTRDLVDAISKVKAQLYLSAFKDVMPLIFFILGTIGTSLTILWINFSGTLSIRSLTRFSLLILGIIIVCIYGPLFVNIAFAHPLWKH